jgi:flagellar basal body-associated protein FliL
MAHDHTPEKPKTGSGFLLSIVLLVLLISAVIGGLFVSSSSSATENEDADRATVRLKNLAELQASDTQALTTYGWNNQAKGIVHIPITKAMELVLPALNAPVPTPTPSSAITPAPAAASSNPPTAITAPVAVPLVPKKS